MKKVINLSGILTILLFSCKKDDISIGTIKVDINGMDNTFNVHAKATTLSVTGGYGIQIQGNYKESSTTNLSFSIVRPSQISTGTYTFNTAGNPLVSMIHCEEVIFPCVARAAAFGSTSNPASVTITEITSLSVRGTFKGELQFGAGGTEILSKGEFYVSF